MDGHGSCCNLKSSITVASTASQLQDVPGALIVISGSEVAASSVAFSRPDVSEEVMERLRAASHGFLGALSSL